MKMLFLGLIIASSNLMFAQNQLVGYVYYHGNEDSPMEDVDVGLYDSLNTLMYAAQTDVNGLFQFDSVSDGAYFVKYSSDAEPAGVDLTDAYYLMLYLLGMYELEPIQYLAADVDGNEDVEWLDYIIVIIYHILYDEPFPVGDWVFEENYIEFSNRSNGDTISNLGSGSGDVDPPLGGGGRFEELVHITTIPFDISENKMTVDILASDFNNLAGFNFSLEYPAEMISIIDIEGPDDNFHYSIEPDNGLVSFIWLNQNLYETSIDKGDKLATIHFEPKNRNVENGLFKFISGGDFIGLDGHKLQEVEITLPELHQKPDLETTVSTYPNPVTNQLVFTIHQKEAGNGHLTLYDLNGRVMEQTIIVLSEGKNEFILNTERYMPGHYFYQMEIGNPVTNSFQGRMYKSSR